MAMSVWLIVHNKLLMTINHKQWMNFATLEYVDANHIYIAKCVHMIIFTTTTCTNFNLTCGTKQSSIT
jgi:hypothetical protein